MDLSRKAEKDQAGLVQCLGRAVQGNCTWGRFCIDKSIRVESNRNTLVRS